MRKEVAGLALAAALAALSLVPPASSDGPYGPLAYFWAWREVPGGWEDFGIELKDWDGPPGRATLDDLESIAVWYWWWNRTGGYVIVWGNFYLDEETGWWQHDPEYCPGRGYVRVRERGNLGLAAVALGGYSERNDAYCRVAGSFVADNEWWVPVRAGLVLRLSGRVYAYYDGGWWPTSEYRAVTIRVTTRGLGQWYYAEAAALEGAYYYD